MAIIVLTSTPKKLLASIRSHIDTGSIVTWSYDEQGDFTHDTNQWKNNAWLRPTTGPGELQFGIIASNKIPMTDHIYGVYHGRFVEMMLSHFGGDFDTITATPR